MRKKKNSKWKRSEKKKEEKRRNLRRTRLLKKGNRNALMLGFHFVRIQQKQSTFDFVIFKGENVFTILLVKKKNSEKMRKQNALT